jgi:hypothetical protein
MAINKYTEKEFSDCILLDEKLRKSIIIVDELQRKKASGRFDTMDNILLNQEIELKNKREMEFSKSSCANKIEYKRLVETGKIETDSAIRSEKEILTKNFNEQYIYIGIGALVLMTSLYLIIRK